MSNTNIYPRTVGDLKRELAGLADDMPVVFLDAALTWVAVQDGQLVLSDPDPRDEEDAEEGEVIVLTPEEEVQMGECTWKQTEGGYDVTCSCGDFSIKGEPLERVKQLVEGHRGEHFGKVMLARETLNGAE